jgi:hypothetical protein
MLRQTLSQLSALGYFSEFFLCLCKGFRTLAILWPAIDKITVIV